MTQVTSRAGPGSFPGPGLTAVRNVSSMTNKYLWSAMPPNENNNVIRTTHGELE
jgi:hypothetical protein